MNVFYDYVLPIIDNVVVSAVMGLAPRVSAWLEPYISQACPPVGCTPGVRRTNYISDLGVCGTFDIRTSLVYLAVSSMP